MTHERARLILTLLGALFPFVAFFVSLALFLWAPAWAAFAVLLLILAALLMIGGQIALAIATVFWACGQCGKRYFAFFMPHWPLDRDCQNCHLPD